MDQMQTTRAQIDASEQALLAARIAEAPAEQIAALEQNLLAQRAAFSAKGGIS